MFGNDVTKNKVENKKLNNKEKDDLKNKIDVKNIDENSDYKSDFYYLMGTARSSNVRYRGDKGYTYAYDKANRDWLKDSIKPRIDKFTGNNSKIIHRESKNTYRLGGNDKDLVKELKDYRDNPQKIFEKKPEDKLAFLSGYIDNTITVDATGNKEPTSHINDKNIERLGVIKNLLESHGVNSRMEKVGTSNPTLKITGLENHRNLRNNLKLENQKVIKKLERMINRFEKPEDKDAQKIYKEERTKCGNKFDSLLKEIIPIIRPNSEQYELRNKVETGKEIDPDGLRLGQDKRVEGIEAKLCNEQFRGKDQNYLKHSEIDYLTVYILDSKIREDQEYHGKEANFKSYEDLMKELKQARAKARTQGEYNRISDYMEKLKELRARAQGLREAKERREKEQKNKRNKTKQKARKMKEESERHNEEAEKQREENKSNED